MSGYDDDQVPYVVIERSSGSGVGPFIWGALLGAATALLLAPKSGEETQRELKDTYRRLRDRAEKKLEEFESGLQDALAEGRRQVEEKLDDAKRTVSEGRTRAQAAFDAGRRAAREGRKEMESEVARARQGDEPAADGDVSAG